MNSLNTVLNVVCVECGYRTCERHAAGHTVGNDEDSSIACGLPMGASTTTASSAHRRTKRTLVGESMEPATSMSSFAPNLS